jgi:hypothetical protein
MTKGSSQAAFFVARTTKHNPSKGYDEETRVMGSR